MADKAPHGRAPERERGNKMKESRNDSVSVKKNNRTRENDHTERKLGAPLSDANQIRS